MDQAQSDEQLDDEENERVTDAAFESILEVR